MTAATAATEPADTATAILTQEVLGTSPEYLAHHVPLIAVAGLAAPSTNTNTPTRAKCAQLLTLLTRKPLALWDIKDSKPIFKSISVDKVMFFVRTCTFKTLYDLVKEHSIPQQKESGNIAVQPAVSIIPRWYHVGTVDT
jgi:hypothetical protein